MDVAQSVATDGKRDADRDQHEQRVVRHRVAEPEQQFLKNRFLIKILLQQIKNDIVFFDFQIF